MVAKAPSLPADEIFFDLEDSVAPDRKEEARVNVADALRRADFGDRSVGVRVNGVSTSWWAADVNEVAGSGGRLDFITVPKVETPDDVVAVEEALRETESARASGPVGMQVLIESALGLTNVNAIAGASSRLESLIFGPADMAASLGMPALSAGSLMPDYPGDHFHFAMSRILVAARAAGLQAIDGPHLAVDDLEGCRRGALRARALGYDGKWVVHPAQIDVRARHPGGQGRGSPRRGDDRRGQPQDGGAAGGAGPGRVGRRGYLIRNRASAIVLPPTASTVSWPPAA
jgi:citrate lyase subunit beta/citryl-CoA lyase